MNCLIVDDNELARSTLKQLIKLDNGLKLVAECGQASEALTVMSASKIDLLLLDIEMPDLSGIDLARSLGHQSPLIIFVTANRDYAADAFDLNVVDFMTKPLTPERFLQSILKAKEIFRNQALFSGSNKDDFIFIRDAGTIRRLRLNDVDYLEAKGDYVKIYTSSKTYSIYSSLKSIEDKLPADRFIRIHRSFMINLNKIEAMDGSTVIVNKTLVPVSEAYKPALNKRIQIL
ncbi:LytR/AlgR family response regulator transcription factor [Pedobacter sp.]|uniref:LytR/AlgR family response regulator transcription factor n=1 Tax=Pedobacter sp. TaxID=1411316 RepID=UPI003BABDA6D